MLSLTFYTEKYLGTFVGKSYGPVITIKPSYKADPGLHAHENHHASQWWTFVFLGIFASAVLFSSTALNVYSQFWYVPLFIGACTHGLLYYFVWQYRLWAEVSAYKVQAKCYPDDRRAKFAKFVHTRYNLSQYVSEADVYKKMIS